MPLNQLFQNALYVRIGLVITIPVFSVSAAEDKRLCWLPSLVLYMSSRAQNRIHPLPLLFCPLGLTKLIWFRHRLLKGQWFCKWKSQKECRTTASMTPTATADRHLWNAAAVPAVPRRWWDWSCEDEKSKVGVELMPVTRAEGMLYSWKQN